jgi:hypothetical protein
MARADQPEGFGTDAIICVALGESGQKRQALSGDAALSPGSSPVMTQDRVMGSLRSSMRKENTPANLRQPISPQAAQRDTFGSSPDGAQIARKALL